MKIKNKTKWLVYTALMTALTAVATIVVRVPSLDNGATNLSDAIIFMTAILMDPIAAMLAGGIGAFLGDLLAGGSTTMLYSFAIHGVEGLVVGLLMKLLPRKEGKAQYALEVVYMLIGGIIMVTGYFFAKAFGYGTLESAIPSLWRNMIQAATSIVVAMLLVYPLKLKRLVDRSELYGEINEDTVKYEPESVKK